MCSVHLEKLIQNLYQTMSIGHPNGMDIEMMADKMNIDLFFWGEETVTVYYRGKCRIFLNERLSCCRQKQEFACQILNILRRRGANFAPNMEEAHYQKMKESVFAKHFCVPSFMLKRLALPSDKHQAVQLISRVFRVDLKLAEDRFDYLHKLSRNL